MLADGFHSELAGELAPDALERFLRYVRVDTQSSLHSDTYPSTTKQLDLCRMLADELRALGLDDVELTEHGYVFATIPATVDGDLPVVGLIAHVDTSTEASGAGVKPQVIRYEGGTIVLPGDPRQVLDPADETELAHHVGHDLVTSDGTTLLGADDKAGVAEIMAAAAYLAAHPEIPHGRVRIGFTVDEEIGHGTDHFDLDRFGADVAYTLDGSGDAELEIETFSASKVDVVFRGRNAHTGTAKGNLVSSLKLAAEMVARLPKDRLSPETTEEREGFVHPLEIDGSTSETRVTFYVRDFDLARRQEHEEFLRRLAEEVAAAEPRARVEVEVTEQYRNMKDYLVRHPSVIAAAEEAIRRAGREPRQAVIRGGTDGARLTEKGLPTPNLFTGGQRYHSEREWLCVQDMGDAAATVVHLVQVWTDPELAGAQQRREAARA